MPVFSTTRTPRVEPPFHVPDGQWQDLLTGALHVGPARVTEDVALDRIPVLARGSLFEEGAA